MISCNGDGECLVQCECECFNENTGEYAEICVCGHREHNGYCPTNCCSPVKCRNYNFCKEKLPRYVLSCHNGMCMNCAIQMGRHRFADQKGNCCVCLENKNMLLLKCNHQICNDCWYSITIDCSGNNCKKPLCPLCRNMNDWS